MLHTKLFYSVIYNGVVINPLVSFLFRKNTVGRNIYKRIKCIIFYFFFFLFFIFFFSMLKERKHLPFFIAERDKTDKMKRSFFQAAVVSILLYGCTTRTLTKQMGKKLDSNYTRILRAILKKTWTQHPTKQQLYSHLLPITKTIKVRQTRHTGHCWRSRDELISDVLLWTPSHGQVRAGRLA